MLNVFLTAKFKKDLDRAKRRGYTLISHGFQTRKPRTMIP